MIAILFIYLIIIILYIYPFCIRYFSFPELPPLTVQMVILSFFVMTYLTAYITNKGFTSVDKKIRKYLFSIIFLLIIVFISAIINYNNFILVIKSLLEFGLIGLLLFLTIIEIDLTERDQAQILKFIYFLIFLQIPITAFQYFIMGYKDPDSVSGTIASKNVGGTGTIAFLVSFLLAFAIAQILINGFSFKRLILALSVFIPPILGGVRIGLLLLPFTIILTVLSFIFLKQDNKIKKSIKALTVLGSFSAIIIILVVMIIPDLNFSKYLDLDRVNSVEKVEKYDTGAGRYSRLQGYSVLFDGVFKNNLNVVLGLGNEVITKSNSANVETADLDFVNYMPDAIIFLASIGVLGLVVIISIIFINLPLLKKYLKVDTSRFMTVVALSLIPVTFNIFVALFYTSTWNSQIGFTYWIILAILFHRFSILQRGNFLMQSVLNKKSL